MEINSTLALDIWLVFKNEIQAGKRVDIAEQYLKLLEDYGLDLSDMSDIEGEDRSLDKALSLIRSELEDEDVEEIE